MLTPQDIEHSSTFSIGRRNEPSILSGNHHMNILFRHGIRRHVAEPIERLVNLSAHEVCEFH
jgi:hypothetical protein